MAVGGGGAGPGSAIRTGHEPPCGAGSALGTLPVTWCHPWSPHGGASAVPTVPRRRRLPSDFLEVKRQSWVCGARGPRHSVRSPLQDRVSCRPSERSPRPSV